MLPSGRTFYKMSGSGNDFVMVEALEQSADDLAQPETVRALCARGTGIGADGLVLLTRSWAADFRMIYLNSDGSRADLCGNATLCSVRLAAELGVMPMGECHVETDSGVLSARVHPSGQEVDLLPVVGQVETPVGGHQGGCESHDASDRGAQVLEFHGQPSVGISGSDIPDI